MTKNITKIKKIFQDFHFDVDVHNIVLDLPLIFHKRYEYLEIKIKDKFYLLLKEKQSDSLKTFVKQAKVSERMEQKNVILVFNKLSDDYKKQLLQIGMSYIDFQENAYLPHLGFLFSINKTKTIYDRTKSTPCLIIM